MNVENTRRRKLPDFPHVKLRSLRISGIYQRSVCDVLRNFVICVSLSGYIIAERQILVYRYDRYYASE